MVTLFGNLESGNVHKVQLILTRVRTPYQRVDVSQMRGEPRRPEFLAINPMGKIPIVLLDDGDILTESGALLYWFGRDTELWPRQERARAEVLRWMFFEQYSHEPALAVLRYLRRFSTRPEESAARMQELAHKADQALQAMEVQLQAHTWIAGSSCSVADIALYPYTKWADEAGVDIKSYTSIVRWLSRVEAQPYFIPMRTDGAISALSFDEYLALKNQSA